MLIKGHKTEKLVYLEIIWDSNDDSMLDSITQLELNSDVSDRVSYCEDAKYDIPKGKGLIDLTR